MHLLKTVLNRVQGKDLQRWSIFSREDEDLPNLLSREKLLHRRLDSRAIARDNAGFSHPISDFGGGGAATCPESRLTALKVQLLPKGNRR
jgi:hypothetical protein